MGFGNETFFSTEIEEGDGDEGGPARLRREYRIPKFMRPEKTTGYYLRFWIFKKVFILSTDHGFEIKNKERNRLKILFGISGEAV